MSRQDSILTANPISLKGKRVTRHSHHFISSILLRWALFLLDSRSLCAFLWNKNPKRKKPSEHLSLQIPLVAFGLHHQGLWIETNSSRDSMPFSSLSRNHPALLKILFSTEVQPMLLQLNPQNAGSQLSWNVEASWSHRHHMLRRKRLTLEWLCECLHAHWVHQVVRDAQFWFLTFTLNCILAAVFCLQELLGFVAGRSYQKTQKHREKHECPERCEPLDCLMHQSPCIRGST